MDNEHMVSICCKVTSRAYQNRFGRDSLPIKVMAGANWAGRLKKQQNMYQVLTKVCQSCTQSSVKEHSIKKIYKIFHIGDIFFTNI